MLPGGYVSMLCYVGHPGGWDEYQSVRAMVAALDPDLWVVTEQQLVNREKKAPIWVLLWRRPVLPGE